MGCVFIHKLEPFSNTLHAVSAMWGYNHAVSGGLEKYNVDQNSAEKIVLHGFLATYEHTMRRRAGQCRCGLQL